MISDTIAAVASGNMQGAVSVLRLSGTDAVSIAEKIFSRTIDEDRKLIYGKIKDKDGRAVDDCLCVKMLAPHSYTGENTVEFYCHGGRIVSETVLRLLIENGARQAERGEFTKRAFLNGKMDLTQAESVIDIITAKTKKALLMSQDNLSGKLKNKINALRGDVINIITGILAGNDFPDETGGNVSEEIAQNIKNIYDSVNLLIGTYDKGRIIREGFSCAVCGKPNVGKSSLLNALLDEERAIVTDIAGTTRDVITESVNIGGYIMNIADTAGIRESGDVIEKMGIERSYEYIKNADIVLYLSDIGEPFDNDEYVKIKNLNKNVIPILNKCDKKECTSPLPDSIEFIKISAREKIGIETLQNAISNLIKEKFDNSNSEETIFSDRHYEALISAKKSLENAIASLNTYFEPDIISIDLENAAEALGEITGQTVNEEVIDNIFKNFCIGK